MNLTGKVEEKKRTGGRGGVDKQNEGRKVVTEANHKNLSGMNKEKG